MLASMKAKPENMLLAAQKGLHQRHGSGRLSDEKRAFRSAARTKFPASWWRTASRTTPSCEQLPLETYKTYSDVFEDDLYTEISLKACVARRISAGGTGPASVQAQLDSVAAFLAAHQ